MSLTSHIEYADITLIGSGIMSANLGALLKRLQPDLKIQLCETTNELAQEASHGWNNAGTGHAGICELSYTPYQNNDGSVDVTKAIEVFQQFEQSKQFWAQAIACGMIDKPQNFINAVPHISFAYGEKQVEFLRARHEAMTSHHFFRDMQFTTDCKTIGAWAPLLIAGRASTPVAATKLDAGTDVYFGAISRKLITWLSNQTECGVATSHRVVDLDQTKDGWNLRVQDLKNKRRFTTRSGFVFVGAGGGTLSLLQKASIPEIRGYGGFPVGGQWLVCDNSDIVSRHQAKVYGQAQDEAPTMAVPHLDTRVIDSKKYLLFGPFAAWTTKFLHQGGSWTDLPFSLNASNFGPLLKVGITNMPLVKYRVQQVMQGMDLRLKLLPTYYPEARAEDWKLQDAGIRVQAIKKEDGQTGIVHYGTEVVSNVDKTISALLGASPGASVSVSIMLDVIKTCLPHLLEEEPGKSTIRQLIPTYGEDLLPASAAQRFQELSSAALLHLQLALEKVNSRHCQPES